MSHLPPIDSRISQIPTTAATITPESGQYSKIEETKSAIAILDRQIYVQRAIIENAGRQLQLYIKQYERLKEELVIQERIRELESQMSSPLPPTMSPRAQTPEERVKCTTDPQELLKLIGEKVNGSLGELPSKRAKYTHPHPARQMYFFTPIPQNPSPSFLDQTPIPTPFDQTPTPAQSPIPSPDLIPENPPEPTSPWQQFLRND